jgi:hypothetical protein
MKRWLVVASAAMLACGYPAFAGEDAAAPTRTYQNKLQRIENPRPILEDHPEFVAPVREITRYEAPPIINEKDADLEIWAWRWSYNARGIIEMPNYLRAERTALIVVHPWGIDDGQGWRTPEPAGVADFCTPEKNHLAHEHIKKVLNPFIHSMRGRVTLVMYSQPGNEDPIRKKLYRSFRSTPSEEERREGAKELEKKLNDFNYNAGPLPGELQLSSETPVVDYFKQFPGLDSGDHYNGPGFWDLPIPVVKSIDVHPDDVMIYDAEGYPSLRDFLKKKGIRHILLTGYCTDMCFKSTCAGYENLSKDFNVFLVGDATLATFPANSSPAMATNASLSFASLNQLITQISWIKPIAPREKGKNE